MDDLLRWPKKNIEKMKGAGLGARVALASISLAYMILIIMGLFIVAPLAIVIGWLYAKIIG